MRMGNVTPTAGRRGDWSQARIAGLEGNRSAQKNRPG